jgi:iron complex transport system substrate-binding protein
MNTQALANLRILSLLPSATEMVCALGMIKHLVGVTHCCDYPPEVEGKPVVVHSRIPLDGMSPAEIDAAVVQCLREGQSVYELDQRLIRELAPTLILSQGLCEVCAPGQRELCSALDLLPYAPRVLSFSPHCLHDVWDNLREIGSATGRLAQADALIQRAHARLDNVGSRMVSMRKRRRVFCMEWVDPVFCGGHWVPEMVELAGGRDVLGRKWADSVRVAHEDVIAALPEVIVVMPCGCTTEDAIGQASELLRDQRWENVPAVCLNQVYGVDAARFSRPSLRLVEGVELLAHVLHPDRFDWDGSTDAYSLISTLALP